MRLVVDSKRADFIVCVVSDVGSVKVCHMASSCSFGPIKYQHVAVAFPTAANRVPIIPGSQIKHEIHTKHSDTDQGLKRYVSSSARG